LIWEKGMVAKTDLTFDELNTALGGSAISFAGGVITISVNAVTGDTYAALSDTGVLELLFKIRKACGVAQDAANETQVDGEKLAAFPRFSYSPPTPDGFVSVIQSHSVLLPLADATVVGPNL
jgi:hypothetical protein